MSGSPIARILNEDVGRYHRWCTPSILPGQERVVDAYASDVSISAGFFGTLADHTGVFKEAEQFAALASGADRTMFSVHGTTGSNWVLLRMLAMVEPDPMVLIARNIHHSIVNAIKAFDIGFRFLPAPYDPRFEALHPPVRKRSLRRLTAIRRRSRSFTRHPPTRDSPRAPSRSPRWSAAAATAAWS
ncbi:MAG TPA: hypothetical protein PKB03_09850 [Baekduia sp.]|nr:hypothetical protein [Baekduia sp.]